jgi:hypothetical protein
MVRDGCCVDGCAKKWNENNLSADVQGSRSECDLEQTVGCAARFTRGSMVEQTQAQCKPSFDHMDAGKSGCCEGCWGLSRTSFAMCVVIVYDVEAVLYTLSPHLPIVHTTFLLYIPPSLCYHRETTTYREVPSTLSPLPICLYLSPTCWTFCRCLTFLNGLVSISASISSV